MYFPMPVSDPCYFCQIVEGKADRWNVIEQTDLTMTLLNGRQFETGQCVVLPVRHAPTLLDLVAEEDAAVMASARKITRAMVEAFSPEGILLYQNNGVGSGQEVPHFHLHVVPRRAGSDWGLGPPHIARLEHEARAHHLDHTVVTETKLKTVEEIRRYLNSVSVS